MQENTTAPSLKKLKLKIDTLFAKPRKISTELAIFLGGIVPLHMWTKDHNSIVKSLINRPGFLERVLNNTNLPIHAR